MFLRYARASGCRHAAAHPAAEHRAVYAQVYSPIVHNQRQNRAAGLTLNLVFPFDVCRLYVDFSMSKTLLTCAVLAVCVAGEQQVPIAALLHAAAGISLG